MITNDIKPDAAVADPSVAEKRRRALGALRHRIDAADTGTLAHLRRMRPDEPAPTFYRMTTDLLDTFEAPSGAAREEAERRWAVIARALASSVGMTSNVRLGAALAAARVAELRVLRLIEARGEQLADALFNLVHQLTSKGQTFNPNDLAALVLSDGRADEASVRRTLARDFYRND